MGNSFWYKYLELRDRDVNEATSRRFVMSNRISGGNLWRRLRWRVSGAGSERRRLGLGLGKKIEMRQSNHWTIMPIMLQSMIMSHRREVQRALHVYEGGVGIYLRAFNKLLDLLTTQLSQRLSLNENRPVCFWLTKILLKTDDDEALET